ncbi:hypothetical protein HDU98_001598 [Podochytrium sp. JEL0797]|nr:hypothetical protein HDU98_001598 [Podochytrium sp. JEL0797]
MSSTPLMHHTEDSVSPALSVSPPTFFSNKSRSTRRRSSFGLVGGMHLEVEVPHFSPGIWVDNKLTEEHLPRETTPALKMPVPTQQPLHPKPPIQQQQQQQQPLYQYPAPLQQNASLALMQQQQRFLITQQNQHRPHSPSTHHPNTPILQNSPIYAHAPLPHQMRPPQQMPMSMTMHPTSFQQFQPPQQNNGQFQNNNNGASIQQQNFNQHHFQQQQFQYPNQQPTASNQPQQQQQHQQQYPQKPYVFPTPPTSSVASNNPLPAARPNSAPSATPPAVPNVLQSQIAMASFSGQQQRFQASNASASSDVASRGSGSSQSTTTATMPVAVAGVTAVQGLPAKFWAHPSTTKFTISTAGQTSNGTATPTISMNDVVPLPSVRTKIHSASMGRKRKQPESSTSSSKRSSSSSTPELEPIKEQNYESDSEESYSGPALSRQPKRTRNPAPAASRSSAFSSVPTSATDTPNSNSPRLSTSRSFTHSPSVQPALLTTVPAPAVRRPPPQSITSTSTFSYPALPTRVRMNILSYLPASQLAKFRLLDPSLASHASLWSPHLRHLYPLLYLSVSVTGATKPDLLVDVLRAQVPSHLAEDRVLFWEGVVARYRSQQQEEEGMSKEWIAYAVCETGKRVMNGLRCGNCKGRPRVRDSLWCSGCGKFACGPKNFGKKCVYMG